MASRATHRALVPAALLQAAAALLSGCASAPPDQPGSEGSLDALALALAAERPDELLVLRYNPVECDCPPWELQVGARWVRASVHGSSDEGESAFGAIEARGRRDLARGTDAVYRVRGEVAERLVLWPTFNTPVALVEMDGLAPGDGPPADRE